ncbi:MAG: PDZ domain-containing protein [Clostridia bacterium]|nr:PDZ domain-containing protein [Clostridia bacterium]
MKFWKKKVAMLLFLILLILPISVTVYGEDTVTETEISVDPEQLTGEQANSLIRAVVKHLEIYGRYEEIDKAGLYQTALNKLVTDNPILYHTALKAMLESVDEHSEYYTAEEAEVLWQNVSGEITTGIGVTIEFTEKYGAVVASVIPDTPADRAGIRVGDVLISADGVSLLGLKSETILSMIRGEAGTTVVVEVERGGATISFTMVREPLIGTSVEYEIFEEEDNKAMLIRVYGFLSNTAEKFKDALNEAKKNKIENLIIDLRDNGGGLLDQAIAMADCFVPEGEIITTEDQKVQLFNKVYKGSKGKKEKYNIVLLMNEYSASASEVFGAALRENELAIIVGTQSYGKGTIQTISNLQTGGAIKYTMGFYLTPKGNNINKIGLTPDILAENSKVKMDPEHFGKFGYDTVYQEGDKDSEVLIAKQILDFFGLYRGELNEEYDRDLYYAVYAFQEQMNLYPYGVLDLTTQLQLRNQLGISEMVHDDQLNEAFAYFDMAVPGNGQE